MTSPGQIAVLLNLFLLWDGGPGYEGQRTTGKSKFSPLFTVE